MKLIFLSLVKSFGNQEKYAKHGPTMRARVEAREVRTMRSGGWADGGDDGQVEI